MHSHRHLWENVSLWTGEPIESTIWFALAVKAKSDGVYAAATLVRDIACTLHLHAHRQSERRSAGLRRGERGKFGPGSSTK